MTIQGNGFYGSPSQLTTSGTNTEIVPDVPSNLNWSAKKFKFYKFSFHNFDQCTVSINGSQPILLLAEQGFETTEIDVPITSFIVYESNVRYQYIGAY